MTLQLGGSRRPLDASVIVVGGAMLATLLVCLVVLRPFGPAMNDSDSAASVVYFQHLVGGRQLEAMVTTTPKPLLTIVYGITWWLTGAWSALTLETIVVFTLAVGLATSIMLRIGLPAAAAFAVVALVGWPELLVEVAHANSLVWALAGWLIAAWALDRGSPRPWLVGSAVLLAALARIETFWLVGAAAVAIAVLGMRGFGRHRTAATSGEGVAAIRRLVPVVIGGALALAVMCLHDWLLTGQPLFWAGVPASYTAIVDPGLRPLALREFWGRLVVPHYAHDVPTLVLAIVGIGGLAASRRWLLATAIVTLAAGVFVTLALLAVRGVYVSDRYWEEADVALRLAAAVGAGWLVRLAGRRARTLLGRDSVADRLRKPALAGISIAVALVLAWSVIGRAEIDEPLAASRTASTHLEFVEPRLGPILAGAMGAVVVAPGVELPLVDPTAARLIAPRAELWRIVADTGVPLPAIGDSFLAFRATDPATLLRPGQWVFHDATVDGRGGRYAVLEVSRPTVVGSIRIVPILADAASGIWLLRIARP
ncbi:MAG: hypothetical protein IVW53_06130 [Chloroflexi bacterium]|nr:hypothetical protein [Chloroflexota bacterium]